MTADEVYAMKRAAKKAQKRFVTGYCNASNPAKIHATCEHFWAGRCDCECHNASEGGHASSAGGSGADVREVAPVPPSELDLSSGSAEHSRRITASKVAAILGVSPWDSPRSIWHTMRGEFERDTTDSMRRGHYLEPGILAWWRDQHPEFLGVLDTQPPYTLGDWAAATPDARAVNPDGDDVLVEAKSAAYDDDWGDPGTDEIPAYYLVQVQWQMHVSGIHLCYVPVLTSRLRFVEYVVPYYEEYGAELEARMRAFYDSLSADEPPELDDSVATFNAVRKVHKDIDRGELVEVDALDARRLVLYSAELKHMEAAVRLAKSTVIDLMGRAQYATHNGVRIARRQPRGEDVTFVVVAKPNDLIELGEMS